MNKLSLYLNQSKRTLCTKKCNNKNNKVCYSYFSLIIGVALKTAACEYFSGNSNFIARLLIYFYNSK